LGDSDYRAIATRIANFYISKIKAALPIGINALENPELTNTLIHLDLKEFFIDTNFDDPMQREDASKADALKERFSHAATIGLRRKLLNILFIGGVWIRLLSNLKMGAAYQQAFIRIGILMSKLELQINPTSDETVAGAENIGCGFTFMVDRPAGYSVNELFLRNAKGVLRYRENHDGKLILNAGPTVAFTFEALSEIGNYKGEMLGKVKFLEEYVIKSAIEGAEIKYVLELKDGSKVDFNKVLNIIFFKMNNKAPNPALIASLLPQTQHPALRIWGLI
jgi:hypothetical protein